ncbi:hypothetical protein HHL01_03955 [Pseudoalteromonas arctica]|uniref:Uncharacterized protein n=1 Tax=Pseudoalteromonas arctica TaxID=394751 RepID=A0A7X9U4I3_9GAMM|nr:hypothetical protein [Pseudoalteromonas arctica]NMF47343.1 hypothetical protein [Pseudoalteromonas arctica]
MTDWIDSKNILKWVKEDNKDLHNWLAHRFSNYAEYFKSENASLNGFIRYEVKGYSSNKDTQKVEVQRLHKAWKSYERGLKNASNKVCKLQLEVTKSARDKLQLLSEADGISQSKYIEKLIIFAKKNPKVISKNTTLQASTSSKTRIFEGSSSGEQVDNKSINDKLSAIDDKITKLLCALGE